MSRIERTNEKYSRAAAKRDTDLTDPFAAPPEDSIEAETKRLRAEVERLRAYIWTLDGKHICILASDGFIDDGIIVANDVVQQEPIRSEK